MDIREGSGTTIAHFRVLNRLGMGGMGVVHRAEDLLLRRSVALKLMRPEHVADPRRRARFLREARTAAAIVHPNVATIYEVGEADDTIYIAMELIAGTSLRVALERGPIDARRALRWATGIASALSCAHSAGVVHRDLTPDNVMVLPTDTVKLLDFGIAKALAAEDDGARDGPDPVTVEGAVVGTPAYVSPEQARGESLDVRSDVFSFGVLLFEMLSGENPFRRASIVETLAAITRDEAPLVRSARGAMPPDLQNVVARCLAKAREDRFADGAALLAALEACVVDETAADPELAPTPPSPVDRTFEPVDARPRPQRLGALGWGAALALAAAVAVRALPSGGKARTTTIVTPLAPTATCSSSAACARDHGGAWRCNTERHECVALEAPGCSVLSSPGDLAADDTVWLGALLPTTGEAAADVAPERNAIELGRRDFEEALAGSAGRADGLHARRIGVVLCDESADAHAAARHLVDDVEVPAVIGFRWAKTALDVIPSVLLPRHVLSFVSVNQAGLLTKIPQADGEPRLVWRSTLDVDDAAHPLAALVSDFLEPRLRSVGVKRPIRVALVRATEGSTRFGDALFRELRFNGTSALDNGEAFRQFVFDAASAPGVVAQLVDFAPDIVVFQGATFAKDVLEPLESDWRGAQRPFYVTSSEVADDVAAFAGKDARRRARFFGLTNVASTITNAELVLHYNVAFPKQPVTRTDAPQPSYDAFYVLGYAVHALGDRPVTGLLLSESIDRLLPPGPPVEVGPSGIFDAFRALRGGGRIDLVGALGSLDFDPTTGEAPIDYAVLCLGVSDRGQATSGVESGLVYDSRGRKLRGTLRCP